MTTLYNNNTEVSYKAGFTTELMHQVAPLMGDVIKFEKTIGLKLKQFDLSHHVWRYDIVNPKKFIIAKLKYEF